MADAAPRAADLRARGRCRLGAAALALVAAVAVAFVPELDRDLPVAVAWPRVLVVTVVLCGLWCVPAVRDAVVRRHARGGPVLLVTAGTALAVTAACATGLPFLYATSCAMPCLLVMQQHPSPRVARAVAVLLPLGGLVTCAVALVGPPPTGFERWAAVHAVLGATFSTGVMLALVGALAARLSVEREQARADLEHAVRHDALTGLLGRRGIGERLEESLAAARPGAGLALLFLDLDGFKQVNDRYGHLVGDELLRTTAARITAALQEEHAYVGRSGGDEFVVVITGVVEESDVDRAVAALSAAVEQEADVGGRVLRVGASIGCALSSGGTPVEDLLRSADTRMYAAKHRRRVAMPSPEGLGV